MKAFSYTLSIVLAVGAIIQFLAENDNLWVLYAIISILFFGIGYFIEPENKNHIISENQTVKPQNTMEKDKESPKEEPKKVESYWAKSDREIAERKKLEKQAREDKEKMDILSPTVMGEPELPKQPLFSAGGKRNTGDEENKHESETRFNKNLQRDKEGRVSETPIVIKTEVIATSLGGAKSEFIIDYNRNDAPKIYQPMYMDMISFGLNGGAKDSAIIEKMFLKYGYSHEVQRIKVGNRIGIAFVILGGQYPNFRIPKSGFIEVK